MRKKHITLFIADDHPIFRRGLCEVIEGEEDLKLVGQAAAGEEALLAIRKLRPAVAILDVNMPGLSGLEVGRTLLREKSVTKVILLTMHDHEDIFNTAIDAGIPAYLLKENAVEDLVRAVHVVVQGEMFLSSALSGHLVRRDRQKRELREQKPGLELLTPTEKRILKTIAEDKTSKEIADVLKISVRTVETHRQNISNKLNLSGSHSLVKFAFHHQARL